MKKEHVVLVLCLIFISFLIYRINDNEIFIQIKQIQVNGKYTIQFKEEGNYKVLNSNNQCVDACWKKGKKCYLAILSSWNILYTRCR